MSAPETIEWQGGPVRQLVALASAATGIPEEQLYGQDRGVAISHPRQAVMYAAVLLGLSTSVIGRALGHRDHSTVIHGKRRVQQRLAAGDSDTSALVGRLLALGRRIDVPRSEAVPALREMLAELEAEIGGTEAELVATAPELVAKLDDARRRANALKWSLQALGENEEDPAMAVEVEPPPIMLEGPAVEIIPEKQWRCPDCDRLWTRQRICVCA